MARPAKQITVTTVGKPPMAGVDALARLIIQRQAQTDAKTPRLRLVDGEKGKQ